MPAHVEQTQDAEARSWQEAPCETLAARAKAGSTACFAALVSRYEARVLSFVSRRGVDHADAEDVTQDTFLLAWRALGRYDPSRRFSAWLFTIAARRAHEVSRAAGRRRRHEQATALRPEEHAVHNAETGDHDVEARMIWSLADRLLAPEARAALWLRYVEGLTAAEIAAALGRTEIGVRVGLCRSRRRLAQALAAKPESTSPGQTTPARALAGGGP